MIGMGQSVPVASRGASASTPGPPPTAPTASAPLSILRFVDVRSKGFAVRRNNFGAPAPAIWYLVECRQVERSRGARLCASDHPVHEDARVVLQQDDHIGRITSQVLDLQPSGPPIRVASRERERE